MTRKQRKVSRDAAFWKESASLEDPLRFTKR